jgi:quinol monooxygenase YgiN
MKFRTSLFALAITITSLVSATPRSEAQSQSDPITVVSHVDIIPDYAKPLSEEGAAKLLRVERTATAHDEGLISYAILQQLGSNNHFTIVETWRDSKSYKLHQGSKHTVEFRTDIQPYLGSPFDSRDHHPFN